MGGTVSKKVLSETRFLIASRPRASGTSARLLGRCAKRGVLRIADFDDFLFTDAPEFFPTVLSGRETLSRASARAMRHRRVMDQFDAFTVSTEALADEIRRAAPGAPLLVVPNGLSRSWVDRGASVYAAWKPGDPRVIRYLPGSTHDADFAVVVPALRRFLRSHPDVSLEVVGHLNWERQGFPVDRVRHREMVPYDYLPQFLASSWVNLAPLVDNRFNRCKSAIKFLEAAAFGCPTIASPIPAMAEHRDRGVILAATSAAWDSALEGMLDDDFRMQQGEVARTHVLSLGCASAGAQVLASNLVALEAEKRQ